MCKRLLILIPSIERGGTEEYALTLARYALAANWEVHAALSPREGLRKLAAEFQAAGAIVHPVEIADVEAPRLERFRTSFGHVWPTARLLLDIRPNAAVLVLCGIEYGLGAQLSCALLGSPAAAVFQLVPPGRKLPADVQRARRALLGVHEYVTVSDQNRIVLAESFAADPAAIRMIPNGVDLQQYTGTGDRPAARAALIRELEFPEDAKIILSVGRLDWQKGYDVLVAASRGIADRFPSVRFVWAGEGPSREALEASIRAEGLAGHVSMVGYRNDIPALLAAADLFVLPTRFEGQPFSLLEAMASGTPIVVTRASGIEEIVNDRVHGLLCASDDPKSLQAAVIEALEHPAFMADCARRARERAMDFGTDRMCTGVLDLFDGRAGGQGSNEFQRIMREELTSLLFIETLEMLEAGSADASGVAPPNRLGVYALIIDTLPAVSVSWLFGELYNRAAIKLQNAPADEEAWILLAVLAFRHGFQRAVKHFREWRKFDKHGPMLLEMAWHIGSEAGLRHLDRLSHSHPLRPMRHYARRVLLREHSGVDWVREVLRLGVLRIRNVRGMRKILGSK